MCKPHSILVVEGAHDAAFFGVLLMERGFSRAEYLADVPEFWKPLIPERYPHPRDGRLERVLRYPDIFANQEGQSIGISVAGGDTRVVANLRVPLELLNADAFRSIGIAIDTDWDSTVVDRFNWLIAQLETMNQEDARDSVPGFPLALPANPGEFAKGSPKVGVHIFPNNTDQGSLETILIDCLMVNHPTTVAQVGGCIEALAAMPLEGCPELRAISTRSGRDKATAGMAANVLKPGTSLAVAIHDGAWVKLPDDHDKLSPARRFIDELIS